MTTETPGPEGSASPHLLVGTAGWSVPRDLAVEFAGSGPHLERYATRFGAVEINSSFHRSHRASTYARWADSVPDTFRFSVKAPREITHTRRLREVDGIVETFVRGVEHLGAKLGCILVQLPPSLEYTPEGEGFFSLLRDHVSVDVACEPRHASWLEPAADALFQRLHIARVAADPEVPPGAGVPGGWSGARYFRLHGSPRIYHSSYSTDDLARWAARVGAARAGARSIWCIFDNTVRGAATFDALEMLRLLSHRGRGNRRTGHGRGSTTPDPASR